MRVYLDDIRKCPEGWVLARNVTEAKMLLETGDVTHLSLDFDLGYGEPTGLDLCRWMKQTGNWPHDAIEIHSSHPLGRQKMRAFIQENRLINNIQDGERS
jgi:hypothetical protein